MAFVFSLKDVLRAQFEIRLRGETAFAPKVGTPCSYPVGAFVSFSYEGIHGNVGLYMSEELAFFICEKWSGERPAVIDGDVVDVVREILNMVYGQAKTVVKDLINISLDSAVPTGAFGEDLQGLFQSLKPSVLMPLRCEQGVCGIEVGMNPRAVKK